MDDFQAILEMIRNNDTTLTILNIINFGIGDKEAQALAEALKVNIILTSLDLYSNQIGPEGAKALAEALKKNITLTSLSLIDNQIRHLGVKVLEEAFEKNPTITSLDLDGNEKAKALYKKKPSPSIALGKSGPSVGEYLRKNFR